MRWHHAVGLSVLALGAALLLGGKDSAPGRDPDRDPAPQVRPTSAAVAGPSSLRALTGTHTRLVWVQDIGDGTDAFARGTRLLLMGFDSDDGLGERPILADSSNYTRPLLTPVGDRVVFSNRLTEQALVVNWDGTGLRALAAGTALAVWSNPADGTEWVYVGSDRQNDAFHTVRRFRIDRPEVSELVWDRTLVGEEFQVSRDGKRAGGVFPWPEVGMVELPNGRRSGFGTGCWASMAPDDSYRLWYFDGAHRNLTLVETATGRSWKVNISRAPGIDGFEVYHPRWGNHPRFMTMTGPYAMGSDGNRIRGGGAAVEVYVGRFANDWSEVERWVRVTNNLRADFYPDVWLDTGAWSSALVPSVGTTADAVLPPRLAEPAGSTEALAGRLVVEALLEDLSPVPSPQAIRPYRAALVAHVYHVERVVHGVYQAERIMVAHWAIRDGSILDSATRKAGRVYRMTLEPYDDRAELEGERLIMGIDRFDLPLFYDLDG